MFQTTYFTLGNPLLSLKQSISQFKNWSQLFHRCIFLLFQFQNTPTSQKVVSHILKITLSYIWQKLISYITFILEYFYYFIYHRCSLFKISCIIWREIYLTCWKKSASPFETIYFTILKLISIISQMHFFVISIWKHISFAIISKSNFTLLFSRNRLQFFRKLFFSKWFHSF